MQEANSLNSIKEMLLVASLEIELEKAKRVSKAASRRALETRRAIEAHNEDKRYFLDKTAHLNVG